jgi:DNA-binding SARP family transcriptional activator
VTTQRGEVSISDRVLVDFVGARTLAHQVLQNTATLGSDAPLALVATLSRELLPGWYDDWVLVAAENWRQLRLHALESFAHFLCERGHFGTACVVASAAVAADPLRETSRAALIAVHLAEGNYSEALREFTLYRHLIRRDLGLEPSEGLRNLLACRGNGSER